MSIRTVRTQPQMVSATLDLFDEEDFPLIGRYVAGELDERGNFIVLFTNKTGDGVVLESNDSKYSVGYSGRFIMQNFGRHDLPVVIQNSHTATSADVTDYISYVGTNA